MTLLSRTKYKRILGFLILLYIQYIILWLPFKNGKVKHFNPQNPLRTSKEKKDRGKKISLFNET